MVVQVVCPIVVNGGCAVRKVRKVDELSGAPASPPDGKAVVPRGSAPEAQNPRFVSPPALALVRLR